MLNRPADSELNRPQEEAEDPSIHYPDSDGEPLAESDFQFYPLTDTVRALGLHFADRPDVYVAGNMLVYYRVNDVSARLAPDVFVVFGVDDHLRRSYFVWREGKAPDFVMEIASESTVSNDTGQKRDRYAQLGVSEYWRFDPTGECLEPLLQCDLLEDGQYRPVELSQDPDGTIRGHSQLLGLDIYATPGEGRLRLYDPVEERWLRNLPESEAALQAVETAHAVSQASLLVAEAARDAAETARASAEAERDAAEAERDAAQERIRQLEQQLNERQSP